ncbi:hypothetical protein DYBT9275_00495 [Dyadobacter sp. CECT 9275]|uniref:Thioredoxin domain-containing protein n=1 Tax=Dyadobacter helix TaxID=2822344 RepID=A0A916J8P7_9BACT|nr:hypothetical protein [Dyadobacter sp. CECT 9275]CAG4990284.1 hypothetical protein DYBT9275_00495 [Dyadobacter sp. CECT 9275]
MISKLTYHIFLLLLFVTAIQGFAQKETGITIGTSGANNATVTLVLEDVRFHPNLGIGLADTELKTISSFNFKDTPSEKTVLDITEPKMVRLQFAGAGISRTWMLFMQPGDDLIVMFSANADVAYAGTNAQYQDYLRSYFMLNQYQYLPVFGYKPAQVENKIVVQQSDSLQRLRVTSFAKFKAEHNPVPAFEAYINATITTEPQVIRQLIYEKLLRRNRIAKLDETQRKLLEDMTLAEFKVLSDDALLSKSYRDELRNWALIPSTRKFPLELNSRYEISAEALKDVYAFSKEKLADFPKQKEYLLTYWLNYAVTAIPTLETGKELLEDYKVTFPKSPYTDYLAGLIKTRESLEPGSALPEITLLDTDSSAVDMKQLEGKPLVMVFAFSIGQHEPGLKVLEEKYKGKVTFAYVSVLPGIQLRTLKQYSANRPGVKHLYASDENIELLKTRYALDIRFPFLVADASGKIINRWIPPEFPTNKTLDAEILKATTIGQ